MIILLSIYLGLFNLLPLLSIGRRTGTCAGHRVFY